eukprot:gene29069-32274_t
MIELVLGTDMKQHFSLHSQFSTSHSLNTSPTPVMPSVAISAEKSMQGDVSITEGGKPGVHVSKDGEGTPGPRQLSQSKVGKTQLQPKGSLLRFSTGGDVELGAGVDSHLTNSQLAEGVPIHDEGATRALAINAQDNEHALNAIA